MNKLFNLIHRGFSSLEHYQKYVLYTWLLVMLLLPVLSVIFGKQILLQGLTLAILLQVAYAVQVLYRSWGWRGMLRTSIEVLFLVWAVIAIIIRSGLPYGNLQFTALQEPQLLGVPIIVPLGWLMMLPSAWAMSRIITRRLRGCSLRLAFILVSALVFTAWAIYFQSFLDYLGILQWNSPAGYFGIPWKHFFSIYFLSGLITFAVYPKHHHGGPLVLIYILTWLIDLISLFFFQEIHWAIIISSILMGAIILLSMLVSN